MFRKAICLSISIIFFDPTLRAETMDVEGVVESISGNGVYFRKASETLTLNLPALDEKTQIKVKNLVGQNKRIKLIVDSAAILTSKPLAIGIRPDCTEIPITYEDFLEVAKRSNVKSTLDFLKELPEGTVQTFTFVHNSNSVQKEGVDKNWPRVLRMSADGKFIFSYTCEPKSPSYNSIEMIRFDDSVNGYRFTSFDFRKDKRIVENPVSCNGCHAPTKYKFSDPRPIWQMYSFWNGVYGAADDKLRDGNLGGDLDDYKAFRQLQKNNPCYASLPWPKENIDPAYDHYPYSLVRKTNNYHLRPNLKFTEIQSHLMGKRIARKFLSIPRFKKLRMLALMDALGCNVPDIDQQIKKVFPKYKAPNYVEAVPEDHLEIFMKEYQAQDFDGYSAQQFNQFLLPFHPGSKEGKGARLYALGKALNFQDADWTMTNYDFMKPKTPLYNTGISSTKRSRVGDIPIFRMAQGEIFRSIADDYPDLKAYLILTRGESSVFGEKFSCIDDLGGEINLTDPSQIATVCQIVQEKMDLENKLPRPSYPSIAETIRNSKREIVKRDLTPELVEKGRLIAQDTCFRCHSSRGHLPNSYQFFNDEISASDTFKKDTHFLDIVFGRIDAKLGEMPPDTDLPAEDRQALKSYFQTLAY